VRLRLEPGAILRITAGATGAWCYLAVAGDMRVPPMLGSTASHTRSGFGGLDGRALASGDRLGIAAPRLMDAGVLAAPWLDRPGEVIRVLLGPQDDYFAGEQVASFLDGPWVLSARGDRMAYFLEGPRLEHAQGFNIVSDGIAMGAIQVPGEGQPIILMADRQPTGGYPKIATVIGPDLGRLAQLRAGARLRFQAVTIEQAVAARRADAAVLAAPVTLSPLRRRDFPSGFVRGLDLTDGLFDTAVMPVMTEQDPHAAGKLSAAERFGVLFDDGRYERRPGPSPSALLLGCGRVEGRLVYAAGRDGAVRSGALTAADMRALAGFLDEAAACGAPAVLIFDGCAMIEGADALEAMLALQVAFRPVSSPRIALVLGPCVGPDALLAARADIMVIATDSGFIASAGPDLVRKATNEMLTGAEIGGAAIHEAGGGLVDAVAHDVAALLRARQLCDLMPDAERARVASPDPAMRAAPSLDRLVPQAGTAVYDMREVLRATADGGDFLEIAALAAANIVTGLARFGGRTVGVLANQPLVLDGALDATALVKASGLVALCASLKLPLLTLVDCPGLLPGPDQEAAGLLRQAALLSRGLAAFKPPRVTLITGMAAAPASGVMGIGQGVLYRWPSGRAALGTTILPRETRRWIVEGLG
jgi:acetyl-CoA carboxylase carboxyltransferase component